MKKYIWIFFILAGCSVNKEKIVDPNFIDDVIRDTSVTVAQQINKEAMVFARHRLDSLQGGLVDAQKYAGALAGKFYLYEDILALHQADSIMQWLNVQHMEKEATALQLLASYAILQHKFELADKLIQQALTLGSDRYVSELLHFDIAFEQGQYRRAKTILQKIKSSYEYGYFFRLAKYQHWAGEVDSAVYAMNKAFEIAGNNTGLAQAALSNLADLYVHTGKLGKANELYIKSIMLDRSDYHSLMGLGWIALVHDKNDSLAERVFRYVQSKTKSPEALFKLISVAQEREDRVAEKKYAEEFISIATDPVYGNMYNKYLVDIFTISLKEPGTGLLVAERELKIRSTPQTYSWYVWALYQNGEKEKAMNFYSKYVSGKPLEGLELYYMGIMMKEMKQGYTAEKFLDAAWENRYDLSPGKIRKLKSLR